MTQPEIYTDAQATDEAVLLLVRKLHRLYPEVHADMMKRLTDNMREALSMADLRADTLRATDAQAGIERRFVSQFEDDGDED